MFFEGKRLTRTKFAANCLIVGVFRTKSINISQFRHSRRDFSAFAATSCSAKGLVLQVSRNSLARRAAAIPRRELTRI